MTEIIRLLKFFRVYRLWIALSIALSVAAIAANIALIATSGWFITAMGLAGLAGVAMNYFTPAAMIRGMIAMSHWRRTASFARHAYTANVVMMSAGFVLVGLQLTGYFVS